MDNKTLVDLIQRADAIKAEADRVYEALHFAGCRETYEECLADAEKTFKDVPSFEKQGTYRYSEDCDEWYGLFAICNECGAEWMGDENFCPNCGARMEGADDESVDSN